MVDGLGRTIDYLRVSVTDRCQLRCVYCMPEEGVPALAHGDILRFEEIVRLCTLFARLGGHSIRLTGGEPLCRRDLPDLVAQLKAVPGIQRVTLTTNGVDLAPQWEALCRAGLDGVNLSLDTLDRALYHRLTRRDRLADALAGLRLAAGSGLPVKVNCVPADPAQALWDVAELSRDLPVHVRFIEMMPLGRGKDFRPPSTAETQQRLEARFGPLSPTEGPPGSGPADYFRLPGFQGTVGFISPLSHTFCRDCNRVRLTATGFLKTCLQFSRGTDLRAPLRAGASDRDLLHAMAEAIRQKPPAHHFGGPPAPADEGNSMYQFGG